MSIVLPSRFTPPHILSGLPGNTPILLAYSGGPDSSALLHMLAQYCRENGAKLYAAHVDHMIRKDEHERDRLFCERTAAALGVELFTLEADVPKLAEENGESLELAARRVRYSFFEKIMSEKNIPLLATAHNADDNLETLLLNLTRGSGLRGMCGIPPIRKFGSGSVIRPVLGMAKSEIVDFCRENRIEYVVDSTNAEPDCSRNIIRLGVVPELRKINPNVAVTALRMSDALKADSEYLDEASASAFDGENLDAEKLNALPDPLKKRAIARFAGENAESVHIAAVAELARKAEPHSSVSLPGKKRAAVENGLIVLKDDIREKAAPEDYSVTLSPGENELCENFSLFLSENTTNIYKYETQAGVSSAKIKNGLHARPRRPGDRITVHGVNRSVKKLMCDLHVDVDVRNSIPVVLDGDETVYIPFVAVADGYLPKKNDEVTYITLVKRIK